MEISHGKIIKWNEEPETKYYFIENDLVSIDEILKGFHWCRIYFRNNKTNEVYGYKTILGSEYFDDLKKAVGKKMIEVTNPEEIGNLTALFSKVKAPLKGH
jgi:hypothetical protein